MISNKVSPFFGFRAWRKNYALLRLGKSIAVNFAATYHNQPYCLDKFAVPPSIWFGQKRLVKSFLDIHLSTAWSSLTRIDNNLSIISS